MPSGFPFNPDGTPSGVTVPNPEDRIAKILSDANKAIKDDQGTPVSTNAALALPPQVRIRNFELISNNRLKYL